MRMIRPKLDAPQLQIAENQDEYMTVTAALVHHPDYSARMVQVPGDGVAGGELPKVVEVNSLVLAFKPSKEELERLAAGDAIYVSLLTFMAPMQPILVTIGEHATAEIYGVEVEP